MIERSAGRNLIFQKPHRKMNAKERVLKTIEKKAPDRIPLDGEMDPKVWDRLFEKFGTDDKDFIEEKLGIDFKRVTIEPSSEFKKKAEPADSPGIGAGKLNLAIKVGQNSFQDEWGVIKDWHPSSGVFHYAKHPLAEVTNVMEIKEFPFPDPTDEKRYIEAENDVA